MTEIILNKRYRLLTEIGAGRMAVVYRGEDMWQGTPVAVKVLRQDYAENAAFVARLQTRVQAIASLAHPNIAAIYELGQDGDGHYLVMELVEAPTLKDLIQVGIPLSVGRALDIAVQVCHGVGHAHRLGIVHGDIRPQNIFVSADGRVKVADFGIASTVSGTPIFEGEILWGTPHYFAPEQAGGENLTPASDVYSIGVIIYEMLAGRPPFEAETGIGVALKHVREEPVPLRQLNPAVPPQVEQIVCKVMAKEPAARYRTADQLGRILDSYRRLSEETPAVRRPAVVKPRPRPPEPGAYEAVVRPRPRRPEEYEEERRGRDWLAIFLSVVAALAVLCLIPLAILVYERYRAAAPPPMATPTVAATPAPGQVEVPNLIGLSQEEAHRLLEETGLRLTVVGEKHDSSVPALGIISQAPTAGQMLERGETIGVVISQGPNLITVPQVEGLPIATAEPELKEMGLEISRRDVWNSEVEGTILRQDPPPGSIVSEGSVVTLIVSSGPRLMLDVNLDNKVLLKACDLPSDTFKPGEALRLTLYWRALQPMQENYTVFVHVARVDGWILTQRDVQPRDGDRPTSLWVTDEWVEDHHELTIPSDAPPDIYWLKVGMYLQATMTRLPVVESGQARVLEDSVLVKELQVVPAH